MPLSMLFPSSSLYEKPVASEYYDAGVKEFLKAKLGDEYCSGQLSDVEKWNRLLTKFGQSVPPGKQAQFIDFKDRRLNVESGNRYNLQLPDALAMFENFYFLYQGQDKKYGLSEKDKPKFITSLLDGMQPGICEPGVITHFNTCLRTYRKDLNNWMSVELYHQRSNIIQRIADEYNAQNGVGDAMSIHTVMHMFKLASDYRLGAEPDRSIRDVYLSITSTSAMTDYFKQVYLSRFDEYERNITTHLAQHILHLLRTEGLAEVNFSNWASTSICLDDASYKKLKEFFTHYLSEEDLNEVLEISEDSYNPFLPNQQKTLEKIKIFIERKLIRDRYFIPLNTVTYENYKELKLRLPEGVGIKQLLTFNQSFEKANQSHKDLKYFLSRNIDFVKYYPSLILEHIITYPYTWYCLPKKLRHHAPMMDTYVQQMGVFLVQALETQDEPRQQILIERLCMMTRTNIDYLSVLPQAVLSNQSIVLKLIEKNALIYKLLPAEMQNDERIKTLVRAKSVMVSEMLPEQRMASFDECVEKLTQLGVHVNFRRPRGDVLSVEKAKNAIQLLESHHVGKLTLARLVQPLTPQELLQIVQIRKQKNLPDLPYCNEKVLTVFMKGVGIAEWETSGYLACKRALTSEIDSLKEGDLFTSAYYRYHASHALVKENQWFLGFIDFQNQIPLFSVRFTRFHDLLLQGKITAKLLFLLMCSVGRCFQQLGKLMLSTALWLGMCLFSAGFESMVGLSAEYLLICSSIVSIALVQSLGMTLLAYYFIRLTKVSPQVKALVVVAALGLSLMVAALSLELFVIFSVMLDLGLLSYFLVLGTLMFGSRLVGNPMTQAEVNTFVKAFLNHWFNRNGVLALALILGGINIGKEVIFTIPIALFVLIGSWMVRFFETMKYHLIHTPSIEGEVKIEVEEIIDRLLQKDDSSAIQKGEALQDRWEHAQAETNIQEALSKRYPLKACNEETVQQASIMEIAAARRLEGQPFKLENGQRLRFFGYEIKPTTEADLAPLCQR